MVADLEDLEVMSSVRKNESLRNAQKSSVELLVYFLTSTVELLV